MIATTFQGEPVYLLPYLPSGTGQQATFEVLTKGTRAQDGSEGRFALRYTLQTSYRATLSLRADELSAFGLALRALQAGRVLCPFWPAAQPASAGSAPWAETGAWLTLERNLSAWQVHTTPAATSFTPSATALRVPLMLGIFEEEPAPKLSTPGLARCGIRFVETGAADFALRPRTTSLPNGPALGTRTPKLFPLRADWNEPPTYGRASVEIARKEEGYTRRPAEAYYPQTPERVVELGVSTFSADESAQLLAFFHAHQGNVESFWLEGAGIEAVLTQDTSAGSNVIHVRDAASIGATRHLAFVRSGQPTVVRTVTAVDPGVGTLTLDAAPGVFAKDQVRVAALILARFTAPKLTLKFVAGPKADAEFAVRETAPEYTPPAGETYGVTLGALPRVARLYRLLLKYPSGDAVTRYTSYERQVNANGEIFAPLDGLNHKSIADSLDPEKTSVKVTARVPAGSVLEKLSPFRLEVPLWLEILECTPDALGVAGAPALRFIGEVRKPRRKGPWLDFEAVHLLAILDEQVPAALIQGVDNNELFGPESGLAEADWTFAATVQATSAGGGSLTLTDLWRAAGVPIIPSGYFAYGRAWTGSGATLQSRTILNSGALLAGNLTIALANPFDGAVTGPLYLSPGYSGEPQEMRDKFGAYNRVCAFPFVPVGSPSLVPIKQETQTGKK